LIRGLGYPPLIPALAWITVAARLVPDDRPCLLEAVAEVEIVYAHPVAVIEEAHHVEGPTAA
jgi:hypothetical protein